MEFGQSLRRHAVRARLQGKSGARFRREGTPDQFASGIDAIHCRWRRQRMAHSTSHFVASVQTFPRPIAGAGRSEQIDPIGRIPIAIDIKTERIGWIQSGRFHGTKNEGILRRFEQEESESADIAIVHDCDHVIGNNIHIRGD